MSKLAGREADLYAEVWAQGRYTAPEARRPGVEYLPLVLDLVGSERGTLLDVGCGSGEAGAAYRDCGFEVTLADVTDEGLVVKDLPFVRHCLWHPVPQTARLGGRYDVVTCTDVLEHVPECFTMLAAHHLLAVGRRVFLAISLQPDRLGVWVGRPLHLTVQPFTWWRDHLAELGVLLEARDCLHTGFYWMAPHV